MESLRPSVKYLNGGGGDSMPSEMDQMHGGTDSAHSAPSPFAEFELTPIVQGEFPHDRQENT